MKNFLRVTLLFLMVTCHGKAEFMVINSTHKYAVVSSVDKEVATYKLENGRVVFCKKVDARGLYIVYQRNGINQVGYLNPLDAIPIPSVSVKIPTTKLYNNTLFMSRDDIKVKVFVEVKPFDEKDYIMKHGFDFDAEYQLIDGRSYFVWPSLQYVSIVVGMGKQMLNIPKELFKDILDSKLENVEAYYRHDKKTIYLIAKLGMNNEIGQVIWVVRDGVVKEKLVRGLFAEEILH